MTAQAAENAAEKIRVLIADDQRVVREGLVLLIGMLDGVEVIGAARDGAEAVRLAEELRPHLVLMDLNMPVLDGTAATIELRRRLPECRVLVLTTYADDYSVFQALRAGARGYLTKDADGDQVELAIRTVYEGRTWLDPLVQERLIAAALEAGGPRSAGVGLNGRRRRGRGRWRGAAGRLDPARGRGARVDRRGAVERPDLLPAGGQSGDGQDAHQPHLREDRRARSRPGGALRVPEQHRGTGLSTAGLRGHAGWSRSALWKRLR